MYKIFVAFVGFRLFFAIALLEFIQCKNALFIKSNELQKFYITKLFLHIVASFLQVESDCVTVL